MIRKSGGANEWAKKISGGAMAPPGPPIETPLVLLKTLKYKFKCFRGVDFKIHAFYSPSNCIAKGVTQKRFLQPSTVGPHDSPSPGARPVYRRPWSQVAVLLKVQDIWLYEHYQLSSCCCCLLSFRVFLVRYVMCWLYVQWNVSSVWIQVLVIIILVFRLSILPFVFFLQC